MDRLLHSLSMDVRSIVLAILGTVLLVRPSLLARPFIERHERRLAELRHGGKEGYFEERRSLEAYPPFRRLWVWRLMGLVCFLLGICSLLFHVR
jgi:hypothetical protein